MQIKSAAKTADAADTAATFATVFRTRFAKAMHSQTGQESPAPSFPACPPLYNVPPSYSPAPGFASVFTEFSFSRQGGVFLILPGRSAGEFTLIHGHERTAFFRTEREIVRFPPVVKTSGPVLHVNVERAVPGDPFREPEKQPGIVVFVGPEDPDLSLRQ